MQDYTRRMRAKLSERTLSVFLFRADRNDFQHIIPVRACGGIRYCGQWCLCDNNAQLLTLLHHELNNGA